jgi:hypothetical protein
MEGNMHQRFTRTAIVALAGLGVIATSAPAFARDTDPKTDRASTTKSAKASGNQRYCVEQMLTGSRVPRRECKTQAEWWREGIDIVKEAQKGSRR